MSMIDSYQRFFLFFFHNKHVYY